MDAAAGANRLAAGANRLAAGANRLAAGANRLAAEANRSAAGANRLAAEANRPAAGANRLVARRFDPLGLGCTRFAADRNSHVDRRVKWIETTVGWERLARHKNSGGLNH